MSLRTPEKSGKALAPESTPDRGSERGGKGEEEGDSCPIGVRAEGSVHVFAAYLACRGRVRGASK